MVNQKAKIIGVIGWIIIVVGSLGSLILGSDYWMFAIIGIMSSIISGVIFIGFAEVIELLQKNTDNIRKISIVLKKTETFKSDELPKL